MPDVVLARYLDGAGLPTQLDISGESPWVKPDIEAQAPTFTPFSIDWLDRRGNVLFHFNPRPNERTVVLNSQIDGAWGSEEVVERYPFPLELGVPFTLSFEVKDRGFRVSVDGRRLCEFAHRAAPAQLAAVSATTLFWCLEPTRDGFIRRLLRRRPRGRAHLPEIVPTSRTDAKRTWVVAEENPQEPDRLESFRLFAVLCTWMEEDVIAATVENTFLQGCERVYLVDNASPDRTVERAVEAGATLARTFDLGYFEDVEKTRQLQSVVDEVSAAEGDEHIWWLFLDADEFYEGPNGLTVREYLATLDRRFRIVSARYFNHMPSGEPAYVEGHHPLEYQPLCYEITGLWCELGHWRHPLQRWDCPGPQVACGPAFHTAVCSETLLEPRDGVLFHHFPFRAEATTRRRLERLSVRGPDGGRISHRAMALHMRLRSRSVDAVYEHRWQEVSYYPPCSPGYVPLRPWKEWAAAATAEARR